MSMDGTDLLLVYVVGFVVAAVVAGALGGVEEENFGPASMLVLVWPATVLTALLFVAIGVPMWLGSMVRKKLGAPPKGETDAP